MTQQEEPVRLSKLMSLRGICSRREADVFIEKGLVSVDGIILDQLGVKILPSAEIKLLQQAQRVQENKISIILNKPVGYVSAQPEKGYRPAIELLTADRQDPQFKDSNLARTRLNLKKMAVSGRLDIDSHGILLFTQDGRLVKKIIGPESNTEKEYLIRVKGKLDDKGLSLLCEGLHLDGKPLKRAKVEWVNESQLRFVLREGKKRQIRRMCELVGLEVIDLKRVRIGNIRLGKLKRGCWRFVSPKEIA